MGNKDWRLQRFPVECPPSLRFTKVVNHKPRCDKHLQRRYGTESKIEYTTSFTVTVGATGRNS
ncbi:hypothetical protein C2U54_13750 [Leclercia sp. LSNIH1]|nr:hypothetical protein C2U54_13750 [Leclercia sp. LSNIH1]POV32835.1 hypothetical protein C3388_18810 [Leclercia sp. LSNIH5]POW63536.1 hypothetical protein C3389_18830 [Leclercia sp. LSNIH2]